MKTLFRVLSLVACATAFAACTTTDNSAPGASISSLQATKAADRAKTPYTKYPFDYCAVNRTPFSKRPVKHRRVFKGQEVLFCCTPCVRAFDYYPEAYMGYIVVASGHTLP
jgi:YHS domain-containing protein